MKTDVLIVGCGCAGLYCALNLPQTLNITIITKSNTRESDSFLAQGGMCVLKDDSDFEAFFEDTIKTGHYENDKTSVEIMIRSSKDVLNDLISFGADFKRNEDGTLAYTKEGAHSQNRIVFHADTTGEEITLALLNEVEKRENIKIIEYATMLDIIEKDGECIGAVVKMQDKIEKIAAKFTVFATGGIGGLYKHTTNFRHLTGDAIAISQKHNIKLRDINYVQIHPTTLHSKEDRSFLISESVRGEGAVLRDKNGERFTNELLPRDLLTKAIREQMEKDNAEFVWEDLTGIGKETIYDHFPNIAAHCLEKGYDVTKEWTPAAPSQHYFMGGIYVDYNSKTSMPYLYAVGETACNGVHGKNRLASNSLLESLVFSKRAALDIEKDFISAKDNSEYVNSLAAQMYNADEIEKENFTLAKNIVRGKDNV